MRSMRHAADVWAVGLRAARLNLTPIILFIVMEMLFAGGLYRLGGGTVSLIIVWIAGVYAAAMVLMAAARTAASRGALAGMEALAGSGSLHLLALRGLLILLLGGLFAFFALVAVFGPPEPAAAPGAAMLGALRRSLAAYLETRVSSEAAAVAVALGLAASTFLLGSGLARRAVLSMEPPKPSEGAAQAAEESADASPDTPGGPLRLAAALLMGPAPLAALALWLDLSRPSAAEAGGYWTAAHVPGEAAVFALAALALTLTAVALENAALTRIPKPS